MNTNDLLKQVTGMIADANDTGELMQIYAVIQPLADQLHRAILDEAMAQGQSFEHAGVAVSFRNGRASYDYEEAVKVMAQMRGIALDSLVPEFTKQVIDWNGMAKALSADTSHHVSYGKPSVSIKVKS